MRVSPLLIVALTASACFPRGGVGLLAAVATTAIVTAAIVSSRPPPPPRVVYVPESRPGYAYQPGYWTLHGDDWVWVDGQWMEIPAGYAWSPTHWEGQPDGSWHLIPGQWVPAQ